MSTSIDIQGIKITVELEIDKLKKCTQDDDREYSDVSHEVVLQEVHVGDFYQWIYTSSDTYIEAQVYVPWNQLRTEYTQSVRECSIS